MKRWLLVVAACGSPSEPPPAPVPRPVTHAPSDAAAVAQGFVGVITAADSVDLAPRFQGVIATVAVRAGDKVTSGQVVAEMDRKAMLEELRATEAALGAASAAKRQADVDVADARRKLELETKAVADGVSPKMKLDEAKLEVDRAVAAAAKAGATVAAEASHVQTARDHLADLALRAPHDGTVAMRFKDPGATIAAGTPIVRIVGQGGLRLRFAVPPDQARGLAPDQKVHATVDTIAQPVAGVIRQVSPTLDPASGMVIVEAELAGDPATNELRPGLAARVK